MSDDFSIKKYTWITAVVLNLKRYINCMANSLKHGISVHIVCFSLAILFSVTYIPLIFLKEISSGSCRLVNFIIAW